MQERGLVAGLLVHAMLLFGGSGVVQMDGTSGTWHGVKRGSLFLFSRALSSGCSIPFGFGRITPHDDGLSIYRLSGSPVLV